MSATLTIAQANAVNTCLMVLGDVGGRFKTVFGSTKKVTQNPDCSIVVFELLANGAWNSREKYATRAEFAAAYGLGA